MLKTMKDIDEYKKAPMNIFGTLYQYTIEWLYDQIVSKSSGSEKVQQFLDEWDKESREYWINEINKRMEEDEII